MIALDASALVDWLFGNPRQVSEITRHLRERRRAHVLDLGHVEVVSAMRKLARQGRLDEARGRAALWVLARAPFRRHPSVPLLGRIWELRDNHTAYDAAHLALAEALGVPLLTSDRRLARSGSHRASVIDAAG